MSMSEEEIEFLKHEAMRQQLAKEQLQQDTSTFPPDKMVIDERIEKITVGVDIVEELDDLRDCITQAHKVEKIDTELAMNILAILKEMYKHLLRFEKFRPYFLWLSHVNRLSYLEKNEAEMMKRHVSIMIRRDILDMDEEDLQSSDINLFETLKFTICNAINDNVDGWKARMVTEQKKIIETRFPTPKKKGFLGRFF